MNFNYHYFRLNGLKEMSIRRKEKREKRRKKKEKEKREKEKKKNKVEPLDQMEADRQANALSVLYWN